MTNAIAFAAFIVLLLLTAIILYGLLAVDLKVIDYARRLRTRRQVRTEGKMITIQPRVNRDPDRSPPEPR